MGSSAFSACTMCLRLWHGYVITPCIFIGMQYIYMICNIWDVISHHVKVPQHVFSQWWFSWTTWMNNYIIQSCTCNQTYTCPGSMLVQLISWNVFKWKHFPRYWSFVRGIRRSPVNSRHKCQWRVLMFSLICAWINGWVNNGEAGDLRRNRVHYDVIVMCVGCRGPGGPYLSIFSEQNIKWLQTSPKKLFKKRHLFHIYVYILQYFKSNKAIMVMEMTTTVTMMIAVIITTTITAKIMTTSWWIISFDILFTPKIFYEII